MLDRVLNMPPRNFIEIDFFQRGHSFGTYTKFSGKTNISYPLIRKRTCVYKGVRNVIFSKTFASVINE